MEICVLKFKKTNRAEEALTKLADNEKKSHVQPWLREVGVIKRPLVGRVSIHPTRMPPAREGEMTETRKWTGHLVSSLAGPLRARVEALRSKTPAATAAEEVEKLVLGIDDLKAIVPRRSSALVLVAAPETCDDMVQSLAPWKPEVIRHEFTTELRQLLEKLHGSANRKTEAAAQ
jgi:hypothetical protein